MEDVAKIRYLITSKTGRRKFKRNIPAELQGIAGQTAYVERVMESSTSGLRQQGNLFAVQTDAKIAALRRKLTIGDAAQNDASFLLSDLQAKQIAVTYFHDRDRANLADGSYVFPQTDPDYDEALSDAASEYEEAQRAVTGEYRPMPLLALKLLRENALITQFLHDQIMAGKWPSGLRSHEGFQLLCRYLEYAELELAERKARSLNLGSLASISNELFREPPTEFSLNRQGAAATPAKTVGNLAELFLETKRAAVSNSRWSQYRIPFRALEEQFGPDRPLDDLSREQCREFVKFLPTIPAYATQHYKSMTLGDAAEAFASRNGKPAYRTTEGQKHLQVLIAALDMAVDEGWINRNPFRGLRIAKPSADRKKHISAGETYAAFSVDQLNKVFALPLFTGCINDENGCHQPGPNIIRRHRYWAPIIGLWTGMRMNEILQLEKSDLGCEDGIQFIRVTDEEGIGFKGTKLRKRLKTSNSLRRIPIHPELVRFGFVAWANEQDDGRLFPEAGAGSSEKPSATYSKRFRSNLKAAGVWEARRFVFHSFRNTFNDALREAGVEVELREAINGWRPQGRMDAKYGSGPSLKRLQSAVSSVNYSGLKTDHLALS